MVAIRVLQSLETLDWGTAEAMVMNLYRNIDRKIIQFDFLIEEQTDPYIFEEEVKELGGRIFTVPELNARNLGAYRKRLNQLFHDHEEWNIIHIHTPSSAIFYFDIAKKHRIATIVHAHYDSDFGDFDSSIQSLMRLPIKFRTNYLLASSRAAGVYNFRIKPEEVIVLKNAIETEKYTFNEGIRRQKRAELGLRNETVVGHVGRMSPENNHAYLLDIFKAYQQLNPRSLLLLIGEGELEEALKDKVTTEDLTNKVKFLGIHSDINEWMQCMDIFIYPSIYEGFPVILIEAQAADLPIMASNRITKEVAITDLISFRNIERAPSNWAKVIDKQLLLFRNDMGEEIRRAGYDVKETAKDLQHYYQTIVENGG